MYERKENIEEENLDWGEDHGQMDDEIEETRHIIHPDSKANKIIFNNKVNSARKLNIKKSIINFSTEYTEISLLLSLLIVPYMVGFFVVSFILLYGGVPIGNFLSLKEEIFHFELWSIGAYLFITAGVIWAVLASTKSFYK